MSESNKIAADLVAAYVSNNQLPVGEFTALLKATLDILNGNNSNEDPNPKPVDEKLLPAVSVKKSITPDYLICLDDGKRLKSLKRHLKTLGMTPDEYRRKWGLPSDYPMVAPSYSAHRSAIAFSLGLGIRRTERAEDRKTKKTKPRKPNVAAAD